MGDHMFWQDGGGPVLDRKTPGWERGTPCGSGHLPGCGSRGLRNKLVCGGACFFIPVGNSPSFNDVMDNGNQSDSRRPDCPMWRHDDDDGHSWQLQTYCAEAVPNCF